MQRQSILWLLGSVRGMLRHGHDAEWLTLLAQVLERSPEASSCLPPSSSRPTSNLQRGIHASILSSGQLHLQSLLSAPSPRSWLLVEPHGLGVTLLRLTDVLCSQMYRVLTKSQHMPAPVQADLGRLEQVGVSGARRRRLRHPARPAAVEPLPIRLAPGPAAAARQQRLALLQPLPLAHLQLCQPQPLALLQQVRSARMQSWTPLVTCFRRCSRSRTSHCACRSPSCSHSRWNVLEATSVFADAEWISSRSVSARALQRQTQWQRCCYASLS